MRFDKLEFERPEERPTGQEAELRVDKDEKYWMHMAEDNRRGGNYETALRFYSRTLEVDKALVPAWVGQVQMLVQLGEYPQASLWSQKALELFPSHGDLMAGQAQAECRMGNVKKAYALSDGALRQRGESAYRWQVRGELIVVGKERTDRHCFDKAQLADSDWLVPLESALIYVFYKVFSKASSVPKPPLKKRRTPTMPGMCSACARRSSGSIRRPAAASTAAWNCVRATRTRSLVWRSSSGHNGRLQNSLVDGWGTDRSC